MIEEIEWLTGVERLACKLYLEAAVFFKEDEGLCAFLRAFGEEEAWHFQIMGKAAEFLRVHPETAPLQIVLDEDTRKKVYAPFLENRRKLAAGQLTEASILSCIVDTEFSEWNDLFLSVVNTLKEDSHEFQSVAARMQGHLQNIRDFLETRPEAIPILEKIRTLPQAMRERVLIVEDSEPLLYMMNMFFSQDFITATAVTAQEGLEKLKESSMDVIISDIEMPGMNGIEFYQEAIRHDPDLARRFLFFSGYINEGYKAVLDDYHVPYILKPAPLADIKRKVGEILEQNRHRSATKSD